jgi:hypothetical protein
MVIPFLGKGSEGMVFISPLFLDAEGSVDDFLLLLGVFGGVTDGRGWR